jgi:hypothetical protein
MGNIDFTEWTPKWPTKPGRYWFYGYPYGMEGKPPAMSLIEIWEGAYTAILDGNFWYASEGWHGKFKKAEFPEPPELEDV